MNPFYESSIEIQPPLGVYDPAFDYEPPTFKKIFPWKIIHKFPCSKIYSGTHSLGKFAMLEINGDPRALLKIDRKSLADYLKQTRKNAN